MADGPATNKMSEAITRTLPFLRRYARAVTGSQKRGDEWVRLCAEVAMQQPDLVAKTRGHQARRLHAVPPPAAAFRQARRQAGSENSVSGRLKESLTDMAPLQRQVLLLTVLEGFTVADAAQDPRHRDRGGRAQPRRGAPRAAARRGGARAGDRGRGGDRARRRRHRAQRRPPGRRHRRDREDRRRARQAAFAASRAGRHPAARRRQRHRGGQPDHALDDACR